MGWDKPDHVIPTVSSVYLPAIVYPRPKTGQCEVAISNSIHTIKHERYCTLGVNHKMVKIENHNFGYILQLRT